MTTKEAFLQLARTRGWYKPLGLTEGAGRSLAKRVRDGEKVSIEKIEEVLEKAGFKVLQEKIWGI